ncbi:MULTISPECIES: flagellar hook assembly protein FlgD [unclassified Luteibacter]|jgi:flagellar basal-body rod modification protein FlgD|uniref:flagellar hook assembly protein FlgD n=1 Tax=Luteibacter sp. PvP019 TaxID=3156436 RepID=UPI0033965130
MTVDAIGSVLGGDDKTSAGVKSKAIDQQDFIKLFVSELQYQDPMQPLDNSQFLLQLSQFESIALSGQTNQGIQDMLTMNSSAQSITLLNHPVQVLGSGGGTTTGKVTAVDYTTGGVQLSVTDSSTGAVVTGVRMSQIQLIQP